MSCSRVTEAFSATLSSDYEAHVKACVECREARAAYVGIGRARVAAPTTKGLEAARAAAQAELKRRPLARPWWLGAVLLLAVDAALAVALPVWMSLRSDVFALLSAALWWALAAGGTVAALIPSAAWTRWAALFAGVAALLITFMGTTAAGAPGGMACAQLELAASLLPVGVALAVLTRFAFDPLRAAVAGMASAAVGLGVLCLHCPDTALAHVVAFHLAPWLAMAMLAAAARRMLPSRGLAP